MVRSLGLLDQDRPPELEALARLAAAICETPAAAINLLDAERQWAAATFGTVATEVPRRDSMCEQTIQSREVTYVPDASADARYLANPHVTGRLGEVRLYVSAPLVVADQVVGTICAFAPRRMELRDDQIARLQDLAVLAAHLIELRRRASAMTSAMIRDPLTGLYNRNVLSEVLDRVYTRRRRSLTRPGVVFVDLNGFKPINDHYGHATGDLVLKEVAGRLTATVRASDIVFRLGGDEFVIVTEEIPSLVDARDGVCAIGERIRAALSRPFDIPYGCRVTISAAVGWAVDHGGEETADQLLHRADLAMYSDKKSFYETR